MRVVRVLVLFAACVAPPVASGQEPTNEKLLAAFEEKLRKTAETAGPTIATVIVSRSDHYPKAADSPPGKLGGFDPKEFLKPDPSPERAALARFLDLSDMDRIPDHGYAGGVAIDADGFVLTPYHVIDGATKVYVFLPGGKGSYADIHAADARADLAVLKLLNPPPKLQAIKFADVRTVPIGRQPPTVFVGKLCVLMANPYSAKFGLGRPSAAFGSITNVRHRAPGRKPGVTPPGNPEYGELLEYDVKPNAGITGGVLLNLDGDMIGLTNAAAVAWGKEIGPGYAVVADGNFRRIVEVLRRGEEIEYGFLGANFDQSQQPVMISKVIPNGPASNAGFQKDDQITHINGMPLDEFSDLLLHIGSALAGSKVKVTVSRFGRPHEFDVVLAKYGHPMTSIASVRPEPVFGIRVDYTSVRSDGNNPVEPGVLVREVVPDSPAAKQLMAPGDNSKDWVGITHVNGTAVNNPADFYKAAKGREKVKLTLLAPKDNTHREITLP